MADPIALLLLLLSRFSHVWLCATPYTEANQAPLSLGFSRQEHWSGLPFPSPIELLLLLRGSFSRVQLCDPIDGSPPGSPFPRILQARTLEWVAISFSNAWKWKVKVKLLSRVQRLATPWTAAYQAPPPMGFSKQEYCHWKVTKRMFYQEYITNLNIFYISILYWDIKKLHENMHL